MRSLAHSGPVKASAGRRFPLISDQPVRLVGGPLGGSMADADRATRPGAFARLATHGTRDPRGPANAPGPASAWGSGCGRTSVDRSTRGPKIKKWISRRDGERAAGPGIAGVDELARLKNAAWWASGRRCRPGDMDRWPPLTDQVLCALGVTGPIGRHRKDPS